MEKRPCRNRSRYPSPGCSMQRYGRTYCTRRHAGRWNPYAGSRPGGREGSRYRARGDGRIRTVRRSRRPGQLHNSGTRRRGIRSLGQGRRNAARGRATPGSGGAIARPSVARPSDAGIDWGSHRPQGRPGNDGHARRDGCRLLPGRRRHQGGAGRWRQRQFRRDGDRHQQRCRHTDQPGADAAEGLAARVSNRG